MVQRAASLYAAESTKSNALDGVRDAKQAYYMNMQSLVNSIIRIRIFVTSEWRRELRNQYKIIVEQLTLITTSRITQVVKAGRGGEVRVGATLPS